MAITYRIRKHERGLLFRNGDFARLLKPGTHRFWSRLWRRRRDRVEVHDTLEASFEHALLDVLIAEPDLAAALEVIDLGDLQRALLWRDGRLFQVQGPGRRALWKGAATLEVETFDIASFRFAHPKLAVVLAHPAASIWLHVVHVSAHEDVLLFRDGVLVERLRQGVHAFWKGTGSIHWQAIDRREQVADVAGQEIISQDKVSLRVNLLVSYSVVDPVKVVTAAADYQQTLYRDAQLALRAAVGTRTIDALLADKESVGAEVRDALGKRAGELGLEVRAVGLRDVILPGDMKALFNQVIAASKEAEANLIRRREETAAARSQANTARLLAENPQLARLRELEALKEVLAGAKTTFVFGAGDIADQVRRLVTKGDDGKDDG